jgi:hypothetical protein
MSSSFWSDLSFFDELDDRWAAVGAAGGRPDDATVAPRLPPFDAADGAAAVATAPALLDRRRENEDMCAVAFWVLMGKKSITFEKEKQNLKQKMDFWICLEHKIKHETMNNNNSHSAAYLWA